MKRRSLILLLAFGFIAAFVIHSCTKPENEIQISAHGDDESHYEGRNCMTCHYTEGPGEGWYTLAGTAYGNYSNGIIRAIDSLGNIVQSIQVDDLGNFFTTEPIDYSGGITFMREDVDGNQSYMSTIAYHGQCNLCHGHTTAILNF